MEASRPWGRKVTFSDFDACRAQRFMRRKDPIVIMRWIADIESAFHASFCLKEDEVGFVECLLRDGAKD